MSESEDYRFFHTQSRLEKSLNTLRGILQGISIDGTISEAEMRELVNWASLQYEFKDKQPYAELLPMIDDALADGKLEPDECQDVLWVCNNFVAENKYYDYITASLQQLEGIIHGILADNIIEDDEVKRLEDWIRINDFLRGHYPYDELDSILTGILADGKVDEEERRELKCFLGDFIDARESYNLSQAELDALRAEMNIGGLCAVSPSITFRDMAFCVTGASSRMKRDEIAGIIENAGGVFQNGVTKKTNYLVVGDEGNPCWAFSCYGRKVEKAEELRRDGGTILIVHETDFWDALENERSC